MGDDYATLQVYVGQVSPFEARQTLLRVVIELLTTRGFIHVPSEAHFPNRVIAVGPAENRPWLAVYDSMSGPYYGSTDEPDEENDRALLFSFTDYVELVKGISRQFGPSVIIQMDDSCAVSFELFVGGQVVDEYADSPTLGCALYMGGWTEEQRKKKAGQPEIWGKHLGLAAEAVAELRQRWPLDKKKNGDCSTGILDSTAKILDWNENLCSTGYFLGGDISTSLKYKYFLSRWFHPDDFIEIYFRKNEHCIESNLSGR